MTQTRKTALVVAYWTFTTALLAVSIVLVAAYVSTEKTMGSVQKIFYIHVPSAANSLLACLVAFVGGIGFLWQRRLAWDNLSAAGATVAAFLCTIALATGMYWARKAWGHWWVWTPRLTLTLMLWLLYVAYLLVRSSIESRERRAVISAVYAIAAFVDVPLVYFSTRLIPEYEHPVSVSLEPDMQLTLIFWFATVTFVTAGLIAALHGRAQRQLAIQLARAQDHDDDEAI